MNSPSLDAIQRLAVDTLNLPAGRLKGASTFQEAGIDSLSALDLVIAVEAYFGISIGADDVARVHSLMDLAACVDRLTEAEVCEYEA